MKTFKFKSALITPEKPVLVLRVCESTGYSSNNFYWPLIGPVSCPDWEDHTFCGNGLHGWLHGAGSSFCANKKLLENVNSLWLVVEVPSYIDLGGKIKFPSGTVVYCGSQEGATKYLRDNDELADCTSKPIIIGNILTVGDYEIGIGGDHSKVTSGMYGTSITGDHSISTSGDKGTSRSEMGISISGDNGVSYSGQYGRSISGDNGYSYSGNDSVSISGTRGYSLSGAYGESICGDNGISVVSDDGYAASGVGGTIIYHDYSTDSRKPYAIGIDLDDLGDVLKPNQLYRFGKCEGQYNPILSYIELSKK